MKRIIKFYKKLVASMKEKPKFAELPKGTPELPPLPAKKAGTCSTLRYYGKTFGKYLVSQKHFAGTRLQNPRKRKSKTKRKLHRCRS